jgi:hypothetical protein
MSQETILTRGVELCAQIHSQCLTAQQQQQLRSRLIVSFDVYCDLLEYTVYLHRFDSLPGCTLEEYLSSDDLVFEANGYRLDVQVDFFLPKESVALN